MPAGNVDGMLINALCYGSAAVPQSPSSGETRSIGNVEFEFIRAFHVAA